MGLVRSPRRDNRWLLIVAVVGWTAGISLLIHVGAQYLDGRRGREEALQRFAELKATANSPDFALWSPQRIAAWRHTPALPPEAPLAVLRIPRVHLEVPVLEGTSEVVLNRGAGHIEDTAMPGGSGNSGIAGHRDGFFRGLKDVRVGDTLALDTLHGTQRYRIERTWVVTPQDVSVLEPTPEQSITLVTCYPFYFVGSAPERYIVRAVRAEQRDVSSTEPQLSRTSYH